MKPEIFEKLLDINRRFYHEFAQPFADSRANPQPGFDLLLPFLPQVQNRVIDVGCGEGRLARFLDGKSRLKSYCGVDFTDELVEKAQSKSPGSYLIRDLSRPSCLSDLETYDVAACLATLQHIPEERRRRRLLLEMAEHLTNDGKMLISTWQFMLSLRQQKKIVPWSEVGLEADDVEANDYLVSWGQGGEGIRYVSWIDIEEIQRLIEGSELTMEQRFYSDGREGNLNLYVVIGKV